MGEGRLNSARRVEQREQREERGIADQRAFARTGDGVGGDAIAQPVRAHASRSGVFFQQPRYETDYPTVRAPRSSAAVPSKPLERPLR